MHVQTSQNPFGHDHERRTERLFEQRVNALAQRVMREGVPIHEMELREQGEERTKLISAVREHIAHLANLDTDATKPELSPEHLHTISTLKQRFAKNHKLHPGINWSDVESALKKNPSRLNILQKLEDTGGEPDVIGAEGSDFIFGETSEESPAGNGRRNLEYDQALEKAKSFGVTSLMSRDQYLDLQKLKTIDERTRSWLATPKHTLDTGNAFSGKSTNVELYSANCKFHDLGFRCTLRVSR